MDLDHERIPRCCPQHADWSTLTEHLYRDFPTVDEQKILDWILEVREVTERFALDPIDSLDVGEIILRYRLLVMTNQLPDAARTDPQARAVSEPEHENEEPARDS